MARNPVVEPKEATPARQPLAGWLRATIRLVVFGFAVFVPFPFVIPTLALGVLVVIAMEGRAGLPVALLWAVAAFGLSSVLHTALITR